MKKSTLILLSAIALAVSLAYLSKDANEVPQRLMWSDMEGYYVYLPATFSVSRDTLPGKMRVEDH